MVELIADAEEARNLISAAKGHLRGGQAEEAALKARDALEFLRKVAAWRDAAHALQVFCDASVASGETDQPLQAVRVLSEEARKAGDPAAEGQALMAGCSVHYAAWQLEECAVAARQSAALWEREGRPEEQAHALLVLAEVRLETGEGIEVARRAAQRARSLFQEAQGHQHEEAQALLMECRARIVTLQNRPVHIHTPAAWAGVARSVAEGERLAWATGDSGLAAGALRLASQAHVASGRYQEAVSAASKAAKLYREFGGPQDVAAALVQGAEANLKLARFTEVRELADEALALAKQCGDEGLEASASAVLEEASAMKAQGAGAAAPAGGGAKFQPAAPQKAAAASLAAIAQKALGVDTFVAPPPRAATPLILPGAPKPLESSFMQDGWQTGAPRGWQASGALEMLSHFSDTVLEIHAGRRGGDDSQQGRFEQQKGAAWVAPVRMRKPGLRWIPPDRNPGISKLKERPLAQVTN